MRVVGLMSGTSHDAVDAAVADLRLTDDQIELTPLGLVSRPYPDDLHDELRKALPPAATDLATVCRLDTRIGQVFGEVAREAIAGPGEGRVVAVASHGQTVLHWGEGSTVRGTLQIGSPAWIAEAAGAPVVADFRSRDVAAGGQGAPLVAAFDVLWLADRPGRPVALNLGGIANVTVPGPTPVAFDTGPANALIDAAVERVSGEHIDADGVRAGRGRVHDRLLERLLADPYFSDDPPKSTGKELFHAGYLASALTGLDVADDDLVATATAATAWSVAEALRPFGPTEVVASGGGTHNPTLMAMLRREVGDVRVTTSDELGVPTGAKEAYAFALLGFLTLHGLPGNVPSCTGASRPVVLGSVTPGPAPLRLPATPTAAPRRLKVVSAG